MGNSGSSAIHLHPTRSSSGAGKENRLKRTGCSKYASPENRVLPPPIAGQKLRITDNGNILHNGGTISGRKLQSLQNKIEGDEEFMEILNRRSQQIREESRGMAASGSGAKYGMMYSHRKTQSDPDIARTLREMEADNDQDDDDSTHHPRSIIAVGASKAKIKSRKKGRAPEPPSSLAGILRTSRDFDTQRSISSSDRDASPSLRDDPHTLDNSKLVTSSQQNQSGSSSSENMIASPPPPPPPPPPLPGDQRWQSVNHTTAAAATNGYEKNKRPVEKWKHMSKSTTDVNTELLNRIRAKSLESINTESNRNVIFNSKPLQQSDLHQSNKKQQILSNMRQDARSTERFKEEILAAAKRRASGLMFGANTSAAGVKDNARHKFTPSNVFNNVRNSMTDLENAGRQTKTNSDEAAKITNSSKSPKQYFFSGSVNKKPPNNLHPNDSDSVPKDIRICSSPLAMKTNEFAHVKSNKQNDAGASPSSSAASTGPQNATKAIISHTFGSSDKLTSTKKVIDLPSQDDERIHKNPNPVNFKSSNHETPLVKSPHQSANEDDLVQKSIIAEFCDFTETADPYSLLCGAPVEKDIAKQFENKEKMASQYVLASRKPSTGNMNHSSLASASDDSMASEDDDDIEINLQLRPTIPKRQFDVPRFSPTEAWKMLAVEHYVNSCHSDGLSSDEGDAVYDDRIHKINKPVAPRRLIAADRCGADSGISPDAGSPALVANDLPPCLPGAGDSDKQNPLSNPNDKGQQRTSEREGAGLVDRGARGGWTPLQDLDDSDVCSVDQDSPLSPVVIKPNMFTVQAKFTLPNTMFPSRSLPKENNQSEIRYKQKKNGGGACTNNPHRRIYENGQQQSHGFKNLKKALGLKLKTIPLGGVPYLDSNWSMSRSIPHSLHKVGRKSTEIKERSKSVCHLEEEIRNSGRNLNGHHQDVEEYEYDDEMDDAGPVNVDSGHNDDMDDDMEGDDEEDNAFWSLPYCPPQNHVIYLPEYGTASNNDSAKAISRDHGHNRELSPQRTQQSASSYSHGKHKEKFTYQSTVRREQRKQMAEKLSQEAAGRELQRQREIEWMNRVEEEFRKQREKEKVNIREQLLMLHRGGHNVHASAFFDAMDQAEEDKTKKHVHNSDNAAATDKTNQRHSIASKSSLEMNGRVRKGDSFPAASNSKDEYSVSSYNSDKKSAQASMPAVAPSSFDRFSRNHSMSNGESDAWKQPTSGMSKWLRRQRKVGDNSRGFSNSPRPEPEGGRSSGDEGKQLMVESRNSNSDTDLRCVSRISGENLIKMSNSCSDVYIKHRSKPENEVMSSQFLERTPNFMKYNGTTISPPISPYRAEEPNESHHHSLSYLGAHDPSSSSGFGSKGDSSPNTASPNDTFSSSENILLEEQANKSKYFRSSRQGRTGNSLQNSHSSNHYSRDPRIVEAHLKNTTNHKDVSNHRDAISLHHSSDLYSRANGKVNQQKHKRYTEAVPVSRRKRHSTDDSDSFSDELPYYGSHSPTCNGELSYNQDKRLSNGDNPDDCASKRFSRNHPYRNGGRLKPQSPTNGGMGFTHLHKPGLPKPFNPKAEYRPVPFNLVTSSKFNHNLCPGSDSSQQNANSFNAR